MSDTQCPVCSSALAEPPSARQNTDASLYKCPQCGNFIFSGYTKLEPGFNDSKHLISAWIRRQNEL
ncbi:MAG TPA: hypothetical protein VMW13_09865, partial [Dehalococcoidales bacterium]|nr:hypothetical protein [Dehalococcoidales bacterium]